jgi:hypothetical protein
MKRTLISQWPSIRVTVNPRTLDRIEEAAERRSLSKAAVVREALDRTFFERATSGPDKGRMVPRRSYETAEAASNP